MGQNIIEINGKLYDALSGRLLGDKIDNQTTTPHKTPAPSSHGGGAVDGFIKRPVHRAHKNAAPSHTVHAKTTRSKTLMRHAVTKPAKHELDHANKNYTVHHHSDNTAIKRERPAHIDHIRAGRASQITKSNLISKFGGDMGITKRIAPLAVKPEPAHHKTAAHSLSVPIDQISKQSVVPESANPFDLALQNSKSHTLPRTKKPSFRQRTARKLRISSHALTVAMGVFLTLFVGGLVAHQYIPELAIKMASTRAGVKANLPSYQPSGFSMNGPVQYGNGTVTINYASNSDERNFRIVQKSSDWNSQSLLENFVAAKDTYQTIDDKGRTVFIYDDDNATWVSGGVWYQIEGESDLSSDQLRRIVSSL